MLESLAKVVAVDLLFNHDRLDMEAVYGKEECRVEGV